jgi:hypothetical protein
MAANGGSKKMKRLLTTLVEAAFVVAFTGLALAQSSGNFAAQSTKMACQIMNDGSLSGGTTNYLTTTIQTPNSSQTALLVGASLVTGLYTNTKASGKSSSQADARVAVSVAMCPGVVSECNDTVDGYQQLAPGPVTYDERFQALTTELSNAITTCSAGTCTIDQSTPESVQLLLSTLSAHHFNFVAGDVGGGQHTLTLSWTITNTSCANFDPSTGDCLGGTTGTNSASADACVGPGIITVQQVKTFSQSGGITSTD